MDKTIALRQFEQLPVASLFEDLSRTLEANPNAVLQAPPGAGKTTAVPLALLNAAWLKGKRTVMLEPRRLAARAAASRMAELLHEPVGVTIGYRVRMDSRVGPRTRIEVVTEGVFIRQLQADPGLGNVGLVIFDEYHERSLDADLALALCRDVQGVLNADLRLLVMSATLDAAAVADFLDRAPVLTCHGRSHPVETRYHARHPGETVEAAVTAAVRQATAEDLGSILAFLPGVAEIKRVADRLAADPPGDQWQIAPLFGNLSLDDQRRAILPTPSGRRKIVLATAIAETSVTIDGIRVVVDGGLSRVPRFDPGSGLTRLATLPVTRASADQRRGRAGRTAPGICVRLWSREQHAGLVAHARPAILEADLAPLVLELALWGVAEAGALLWRDPPPAAAFQQARRLLGALDALDRGGRITAHGRAMAELPLHPRLAHMLLRAASDNERRLACDLAALLSERDIVQFGGGGGDADLRVRHDILECCRRGAWPGGVNRSACRQVLKTAGELRRRLDIPNGPGDDEKAGRLLAWAYPDRIAQRRPERRGRFLLSVGRGAYLDPTQPLAASDYLVAAALDGDRSQARIFLAAAIGKEDLQRQFRDRLQWVAHVDWDPARQIVQAERRLMFAALCLRTEALTEGAEAERKAALVRGIRQAGAACLPWTRALRAWQQRVVFLRRIEADAAEGWPDVSDAGLAATLEEWLGPYLEGLARLSDLRKIDLAAALKSLLTWRQQQRLDALAPTHLTVPSGSRRPIDYSGEIPVLAVRIQEMFGARETPAIAAGRQPLLLHLLSPAGRTAQITQDLDGFWENSYPAVRKDLRGRYPKHDWPEDPHEARPTARVRPR